MVGSYSLAMWPCTHSITSLTLELGRNASSQAYPHLLNQKLRESIPRQVDKKSRVPKEEKGVWGSWSGDWASGILKEEKRTNFFFFLPLHSLVLVNYTTQFKLCTRDYTTAMSPAGAQFLLPENLLTPWYFRMYIMGVGLEDLSIAKF